MNIIQDRGLYTLLTQNCIIVLEISMIYSNHSYQSRLIGKKNKKTSIIRGIFPCPLQLPCCERVIYK